MRESRAYAINQLPPKTGFEIAVIGRSNAGKSSFINCIVGKAVAKVAQSPGATLWLGMHEFAGKTIIDLPGYGYAQTGKARREILNQFIFDYFKLNRTDLLLMLVDMRRGVMEIDREIMRELPIGMLIIGTKSDKRDAVASEVYNFTCSAKTKVGIREIMNYISIL